MKKTLIVSSLLSGVLACSAGATTVNLAGGVGGLPVLLADGSTPADGSTVEVGILNAMSVFEAFVGTPDEGNLAVTTVLPGLAIETPGQLVGSIANDTATADSFNGQQVFIQITAANGDQGLFSSTGDASQGDNFIFPVNDPGGVADTVALNPLAINVSAPTAAGVMGTITAEGLVLAAIPEPSSSILALAGLGAVVIRRRRS